MTAASSQSDEVPERDSLRFHFRRLVRGDEQENANFLEWSYEVTCNEKSASTRWAPKRRKRLREVLDRFCRGELTSDDLAWLAPVLNEFLCGEKGTLHETIQEGLEKAAGIELTVSNEDSSVLLTNIPWEITACRRDYSKRSRVSMEGLFAKMPLTRLIAGKKVQGIADSRLRLLYCISNPSHWTVSTFKAQEFETALERVLRQFPIIDAKASKMKMNDPASSVLESEIHWFKPHIFVFVGHGDSSSKSSKAPQLLLEDWLDFDEIAYPLVTKETTLLVILVCCDMTRRTEAIGGWSGAQLLTRKGVPAVVAMQGDVDPEFAQFFMEYLLGSLLVHHPVLEAVSISRDFAARKAQAQLQAFLPTTFSNMKSPAEPIIRSLREYRNKVSVLAGRIPGSFRYMARPQMEERMQKALEENGLFLITGGLGCGKSTLLSKVVGRRIRNEKEAPARPIFYISCDEPGAACKTPLQLFSRIARLIDSFRELLSDKKLRIRPAALESFFVELSRKKIITIVDNFTFPSDPQAVVEWTNSLKHAAAALHESLFIFATGEIPPALTDIPGISVGPFSGAEIRQYLRQFAAPCLPLAGRIGKELGGLPLLLDALRSRVEDNEGKCDVSFLKVLSSGNIPESYLRSVNSILGPYEQRTFCNICRLPAPTTIQLAREFLDSTKDGRTLPLLLRLGIVRKTIRNTEEYCYVPSALSIAAKRVAPEGIARAARNVTARFEAKLPREASAMRDFVKTVATQSGGMTLLKCIQSAYLAQGHLPHARDIAELAEGARLERASLWRLYKGLLRYFSGGHELPFRLRAAELAQGLGRARECEHILETIPKDELTPYYHVKFLKVQAAVWKDTKQHAGISEILKSYDESVPMAREGLAGRMPDTDANPEDWKKMLTGLLHDRLMVSAFLQHASRNAIVADLEELRGLLGDSPEFGNELCLVAEYELKAPPQDTDWDGIAERLLEARRLLENNGHDRYLSQCLYFYGEYLRRRKPDPKPHDAAQVYHEAEQIASRVGDHRRTGRAIRRWVDLEWRALKTLSAAEASESLEKAIAPLADRWEEALSMRVLERLYTLRAEIGKQLPADPTKDFLMLACQAADQPALQGRSDNIRYGRALRRYLGEINKAGNFAEAQQYLHDHQNAVRQRLGLDPMVNDPWGFYAILQEKYPDEKEE